MSSTRTCDDRGGVDDGVEVAPESGVPKVSSRCWCRRGSGIDNRCTPNRKPSKLSQCPKSRVKTSGQKICSKNRQKLDVDYVESLEDVVKVWSQTGAGKLSKFAAKRGVKWARENCQNL